MRVKSQKYSELDIGGCETCEPFLYTWVVRSVSRMNFPRSWRAEPMKIDHKLDQGLIRSSLMGGSRTPYRLTKEQCLTVTPCPYPHGGPAFDPSCTEFVYPEC